MVHEYCRHTHIERFSLQTDKLHNKWRDAWLCMECRVEFVLEAELATAKQQIGNERLKSRLMGLEDGASMMDGEVAELKAEVQRLQEENAKLEVRVKAKQRLIEDAESELDAVKRGKREEPNGRAE